MVCTGDTLIFGIELTVSEAFKYAKDYISSDDDSSDDDSESDDSSDYSSTNSNDVDKLETLYSGFNLSVEIIKPPCCLFKHCFSKIYFGVVLGSNDLVCRFDSFEFDTIDDYEAFYTEELNNAKKLLQENKNKYINDIRKIIPDIIPKFYTIPNDCFSCT